METSQDRQQRRRRYTCAGQGITDCRRKYELEGQEKWKEEEEKMRPGEGDEGGEVAQDENCKKRGKEKGRKTILLLLITVSFRKP
jgi:hypothetical protein